MDFFHGPRIFFEGPFDCFTKNGKKQYQSIFIPNKSLFFDGKHYELISRTTNTQLFISYRYNVSIFSFNATA